MKARKARRCVQRHASTVMRCIGCLTRLTQRMNAVSKISQHLSFCIHYCVFVDITFAALPT